MTEKGLGWVTSKHGLLTIDLNDGSVLNYRRYDADSPESSFLCDIKSFDLSEYLGTEFGTTDPRPFPEKFDLDMLDYELKNGTRVKHDPLARKQMHNMQAEAKKAMAEKKFKRMSWEDVEEKLTDLILNIDDRDDFIRIIKQLTGAYVEYDDVEDDFLIYPTEDYMGALGDI